MHKENAFRSAFLQPAKFCFACLNDQGGHDHVEVHATNDYSGLLASTLQVQLPFPPTWSDGCHEMGLIEFWDCGPCMEQAWTEFAKPEHFGLSYEGIRALKNIRRTFFVERCKKPFLKGRGLVPKQMANAFADPSQRAGVLRVRAAKYLERWAYFFTRDFFLTKCVNVMSQEGHPEFTGFVAMLQVLFDKFKMLPIEITLMPPPPPCNGDGAEDSVDGEDGGVMLFLFDEDTYELRLDRAESLFRFAGLL